MMVHEENVRRLVRAAFDGMIAEQKLHGLASGADVIAAGVQMARMCINFACSSDGGCTLQDVAKNKQLMKNVLMEMMLLTADELKVM